MSSLTRRKSLTELLSQASHSDLKRTLTAKSLVALGVGAIIGAPFMLGTLALFISGLAVIANRKKRADYPLMRVDTVVMRRDMEYFLALYTIAIVCTFLTHPVLRVFIAVTLILLKEHPGTRLGALVATALTAVDG